PFAKENAERLVRSLIVETDPPANACFVRAVMLERKRVRKRVRTENTNGSRLLIYEHREDGAGFIVRDPQLRLSERERVQDEVTRLLGTGAPIDHDEARIMKDEGMKKSG